MKVRSLALALAIGVVLGLLPILPVGIEPAWAHHDTAPVLFDIDGESEIVDQPFTILGYSWEGDPPDEVWFRTRSGRGPWTDWAELHIDDQHAPDPGTVEFSRHRPSTDPVWVGAQDQVQFRVTGNRAGGTATLVDTTNRTKPFIRTIRDELTPRVPAAGASHPGQPAINPRSAWDPFDSCQQPDHDPPEYIQVTHLFIHHTTSSNSYAQSSVPSMIAGFCSFHVNTNGWNDIGYNFLVDRFGTIWEGRAGGVDRGVSAAHAQGFNTYSAGIGLIGNFTVTPPSAAQRAALEDLLAWKSGVHNLDPDGATTVVSKGSNKPGFEEGVRVTLPTILGHRDTVATSCPGNACYVLIPSIRVEVGSRFSPLLDAYIEPRTGDMTGDGLEDGLVLDPDTGQWWLSDAGQSASVWATQSPVSGWDDHVTGDFDGDGRTDLASYRGGAWTVRLSQGSSAAAPVVWGSLSPATGWDDHVTGDFDGDGRTDIASVRAGIWTVSLSTGGSFDSQVWGTLSPTSGWADHVVGDFDGNGRSDIASIRNGAWTVGTSTGSGFSFAVWGSLSPTTGWDSHLAGDFDGDGRDDLASYRTADQSWALLPSTGTGTGAQFDRVAHTHDHWSLRFTHDWDSDGTDEIMMLDAYDGTWEQGTFDGTGLTFRTLEDTPYRTHVFRDTDYRGSGTLVTFFGQEYRWLQTEIGDGLGESQAEVTRLAGLDRYRTAVAVSQDAFPGGADTVLIATGENFPDSLAGVAAGYQLNAPILLTNTSVLNTHTKQELSRLDPEEIIILGGTAAVTAGVEAELQGYAPTVTRLAGPTRYETATAISQHAFGADVSTIFVVTGADFPEAVIAGPAAVAFDGPVLLTRSTSLPSAVRQEIRRLGPDAIVLVAPTTAVSADVEAALAAYAPVTRIAGADRYATSALVSSYAFGTGVDAAYTATGADYPDALTGGVAAALDGGPILLVRLNSVPSSVASELGRLEPLDIRILGGVGVVTDEVAESLGAFVANGPAVGSDTIEGAAPPLH